jgi:uncharacterized protein (TIGR02453 family)
MQVSDILQFLGELSENNHKVWFDSNRARYEELRKYWLECVDILIKKMIVIDHTLTDLEAKNCIFRINRDVRFSKNKEPYKTYMGAYLSKGGKASNKAGYYVHLEPNASFIAAGVWMPEPKDLFKIRQEIEYNLPIFENIVKNAAKSGYELSMDSGKLSSVPKGFDKQSEAAPYLKHKSFIFSQKISWDKNNDKATWNDIYHSFQNMKPLVDFVNKALDSE